MVLGGGCDVGETSTLHARREQPLVLVNHVIQLGHVSCDI